MRDILASLDRENVGWKMVYNFLGNDGKISTYSHLNIIVEKKSDIFSCSVSKQKPCDYHPVSANICLLNAGGCFNTGLIVFNNERWI